MSHCIRTLPLSISNISSRHVSLACGRTWNRSADSATKSCSTAWRTNFITRNLVQSRAHSTQFTRSAASAAVQKKVVHSDQAANLHHDLPTATIDQRKVSIGWSPQNWSRFHHVWLRDHCRCPACFHPVTKQRLVNTFDISPDLKPSHVESRHDGLEVIWPAGVEGPHSSLYPWSWLRTNSYDPPPHQRSQSSEKILWGSRIEKSPPTISFEEAMNQEQGLYRWLSHIDQFGFCLVTGVPPTPEATEELSRRIGFIRETQYGGFWEFTSDLAKGDTAYTTMALGAHTDNTYFTDPCGIQLFHVLSHTDGSGGATLLVDGFYVANILKELHPELYDVLSRVPIPAHAAGEPTALYTPKPSSGYPTLTHDAVTNDLIQVRWNNDDRSVMNHLDASVVEKWYDAIRTWHNLLTSPDSEYWIQLTPGVVLAVDNHRVLHGRSAFNGKRRVCGAYIGVDEYRSKFAVLRERFTRDDISHDGSQNDDGKRSVWNPVL